MGPVDINCSFVEDFLEEILAGKIPPGTIVGVNNHLAGCARCRQLVGIAEGKLNPWPGDPSLDFTREVLEKTSGTTCDKARSQLCAWVDRELGEEESELLGSHLEHCPTCEGLVAILLELKAELPSMAEVIPDPGFCQAVLKATVMQRNWRIRAVKWWESLFQRPRFAWEAAYLGTLVIFGFLGVVPVSKATMSISAKEILPKQPVAFIGSINWSAPTMGVIESQFAHELANSINVKVSDTRRTASGSLDGARQMTRQLWIAGFTMSSDGAAWLRKKADEFVQRVRFPQAKSPQSDSSSAS